MDIQVINPIGYHCWNELILKTKTYSFFHSSDWAKVLNASYRYTPFYFTLFNGDKIAASIPIMEVKSIITGRRGVSLPFTDYCEPIFDEDIQFKNLYYQIIDYGKKLRWRYLELRDGQEVLNNVISSEKYLHHSLDLTPKENTIFSKFGRGTKSSIHKAARDGVVVRILNTLESINEFYKLNNITRKRHGLPPQPLYFFKKLYKHVISENLGFVALAYFQEKVIAGAIYVHFGEKAIYKYGASDAHFQRLRANNLIMWEAIQWYCQHNYRTLCFGRTELKNEGLRRFKTGWGTKEDTINYYKYDLRNNVFVKNRPVISAFNSKIFSKMPVHLLNILGSLLYRHMG